jgi:uncharacterized protein YjbI with pentapeptide repeats
MAEGDETAGKFEQAFFLALAAKGRDEWNKWRHDSANNSVTVTFAGVDFSETPRNQINFSGFDFGQSANFSRCRWPGAKWKPLWADGHSDGCACFAGAVFGTGANFTRVAFGSNANFKSATFGSEAIFKNATFGHRSSFLGSTFGGPAFGFRGGKFPTTPVPGAIFVGAAFGDDADFTCTVFGKGGGFSEPEANFTGATFGKRAAFAYAFFGHSTIFGDVSFGDGVDFRCAIFSNKALGNNVLFRRAVFRGRADFTGKPIDQWMVDVGERMIGGTTDNNFRETLKQRCKALWQEYTTSPDQFAEISFADARFCRDVDFSGRSFTRFADFTGARFYRPPVFEGVTRVDRIDFTGAYIGFSSPHRLLQWNSDSLIPIRFRALRKVAEDTKNHDLERDLYIEERKAERGVYLVQRFREWIREPNKKWALLSHILWIVVMVTYSVLADYGRSFVRPAAWLIASMFFFYWRYTELDFTDFMPRSRALP